mgnify:CR=1 FL=1
MDISFYELTATSLEKMLPKLLEKAYDANQRVVVLLDSEERVHLMNATLWTYATLSFLPHGSQHDSIEDTSRNPIWLTTHLENPNDAQVIIITTEESLLTSPTQFQRCLDIFDGNNPQSVAQAHQRYRSYQEQGYTCVLWRQSLTGQWEKATLPLQ